MKRPYNYATLFARRVIKDYNSGKLTLDNMREWEIEYNGGEKPNPPFNTKEIIDYYVWWHGEAKSENIMEHANAIREYCAKHILDEESCPFFKGYREEEGANIVICELNKGQCSPCNWEL